MQSAKSLIDAGANASKTVFINQDGAPHVRDQFLNASEAASCIRRLVYEKTWTSPDPEHKDHYGYLERGHTVEDWVVQRLAKGLEVSGGDLVLALTGKDQRTLADPSKRLSATPDGILLGDNDEELIEVKSIDPRTNKYNLPKDQHIAQVQIQIALVRRLTHYEPTKARLIYVDASNYSDILEFEVLYDPDVLNQMTARADQVFRAVDRNDPMSVPAEGTFSDECAICPFQKTCRGDRVNAVGAIKSQDHTTDPDFAVTLDGELAQWSVAKGHEKNWYEQRKASEDRIKNMLSEKDYKEFKSQSGQTTMSVIPGRETFDEDAMRRDGLDPEIYKVRGDPHERLTVNAKF